MAKIKIKITALILSIIYILCFSISSFAASIGTILYELPINIANNSEYKKVVAWHQQYGRQEANVITYTPVSSGVRPIIAFGSKLYGRSDINQAIDYATNTEGEYVMGGINGDFYSLQTGVPLGMVVHNKKLISSDDSYPAVGFKPDGSCIIGNPGLTITMKCGENTTSINHFNKYRTEYGVYLFSDDFSAQSRTNSFGTHIVLEILSGEIAIGQAVETRVIDIMKDAPNIAMQEGTLLLSVDNNGPVDCVDDLALGQELAIVFDSSNKQWCNVTEAIGGGQIIVQNGAAVKGTDAAIAGVNPRTAIGVKANGQVVMAQIDGRQKNHSAGATFDEFSEFMISQGCVTVLNLDGGGSSATAARMPGHERVSVVNSPSDGGLRVNANFILLVNTAAKTNSLEKLQIYPYDIIALPNTTIDLKAMGMDENYYAMTIPSSSLVSYSVEDKSIGTMQKSSGNAWTFTSLNNTGDTVINAKSGQATGKTAVTVVDRIDDMYIYEGGTTNTIDSIDVSPGEIQEFDADAFLNTRQVYSNASSFKWEVSDKAIGEFISPGVFEAGTVNGAQGYITVSYKDLSKTVKVNVGRDTGVIYDFDKATKSFTTSYNGIVPKVSINNNKEFVRYGTGSMTFNYKEDSGAPTGGDGLQSGLYASLDAIVPQQMQARPTNINLWVFGDNSNNEIYATVIDSKNNEIKINYDSALNFSGWRLVSASINTNNYPIRLKTPFGIDAVTQNKEGTLYLDQLSVTYGAKLNDFTGPQITIDSLDNWDKTSDTLDFGAYLKDDSSAAVLKENISVKVNAKDIDFNYDQSESRLSASIKNTFGPGLCKISITAADSAGNISYKYITLDFPKKSGTEIFTDTVNHWADKYIDYMYNEGIAQGTIDDFSKERYFFPETDITRAEFAIMLSRFLKLDTSQYLDTKLPFADADEIKDWALPQVKAVYANNIMNGKPYDGGRLIFDPNAKLTRAEVITAVGKLLNKGYKEAEVNFSDKDDIGAWAYPYVGTLTGMGVINGYQDGTLMPANSVKRAEVAKILFSVY